SLSHNRAVAGSAVLSEMSSQSTQVTSARPPGATLFFPPYCESALDGPYLGVHQLVAHLRREGIACRSYDLNVRFFRWLAEPGGQLDRLTSTRIAQFLAAQSDRTVTPARAEAYRDLVASLAYAPTALVRRHAGERVLSSEPADSLPAAGAASDWWSGGTNALF